MARRGRSARGDVIDFDLIAIRQQLADAPTSVNVNARRTYIDTKDGIVKKDSTVAIGSEDYTGNDEPLPADFTASTTVASDPFDLVNG